MNDVKVASPIVLTTLEIADMMEMKHWQILRKLDGTKKTKGIIQILGDNKIVVSDYFIKSTYRDESGKENPCYDVTRMGCEFLANKFTGEKGVIFTALYVKRFHEMEDAIKHSRIPTKENTDYIPKVPLVQDWYGRNRGRIERFTRTLDVSKKELYHNILKRISERYDLEQAREIYKDEVGHYPIYAMDIVGYFPELGEAADDFLDRVQEKMIDKRF